MSASEDGQTARAGQAHLPELPLGAQVGDLELGPLGDALDLDALLLGLREGRSRVSASALEASAGPEAARRAHLAELHVHAHEVRLDALILVDEAVELDPLQVVGLGEGRDAVCRRRGQKGSSAPGFQGAANRREAGRTLEEVPLSLDPDERDAGRVDLLARVGQLGPEPL